MAKSEGTSPDPLPPLPVLQGKEAAPIFQRPKLLQWCLGAATGFVSPVLLGIGYLVYRPPQAKQFLVGGFAVVMGGCYYAVRRDNTPFRRGLVFGLLLTSVVIGGGLALVIWGVRAMDTLPNQ